MKQAVLAPSGANTKASGAASEVATTERKVAYPQANGIATSAPPSVPHGDPVLDLIERAARDISVDVTKIQALLDMREKQLDRLAEEAFNEAMRLAQQAMGAVRKDAENPHTRSKYVSFEALDGAIRPIYTEHGFSLSWDEEDCPKPEHLRVICYVSRGRYTRKYHRDMPITTTGLKGQANMSQIHATGSAFSYGKRYLEAGIFNIAFTDRDDDGNAAGGSASSDTGEVLSADNVANLKRMLKFKNRTEAEFMDWVRKAQPNAKTIEDIRAGYYDSCVKMISQVKVQAKAQ